MGQGKIKEILRRIYFCGGDKIREEKDLAQAEQSINNTRLSEEEITNLIAKNLPINYDGTDPREYHILEKLGKIIYSAQTKKLE